LIIKGSLNTDDAAGAVTRQPMKLQRRRKAAEGEGGGRMVGLGEGKVGSKPIPTSPSYYLVL
jgi:hypothetical protein